MTNASNALLVNVKSNYVTEGVTLSTM